MDILGPITTSKEGYKYILLVVDSFSKWPEAFPLKTQDSKEIAKVLYSEIFARYGAPRVIVSDRGQNFLSKLVTSVCEIFQVTRHFTSSYHPQTNATCERMNSTIAQCLRAYVDKDQTNWPEILPGVMMALRMSPSTQSSDLSPFHLLFGKEMNLPFDISLIPKDGMNKDANSHVLDLMSHLKTVKEIATDNIKKAQEKQKHQYDKKSKQPTFRIGELVMLHSTRVPQGLSPKLHCPWDGPFYITSVGPNCTYKLRRCSTHKELKSHIHANRLKSYNNPNQRPSLNPPPVNEPIDDSHQPPDDPPMEQKPHPLPTPAQNPPGQPNARPEPAPPTIPPTATKAKTTGTTSTPQNTPSGPNQAQPEQSASTNQYYVDKLLRYKYVNGRKHFRVKWLGHSERSWEPEENLPPALVRQFHITKTQKGTTRKVAKKPTCLQKTK